ncbi:hypothetical protein P5V15_001669 [Pogonomyrmex californicus]
MNIVKIKRRNIITCLATSIIESLTGIIFYVIPVMILLISNVRFFILTSSYCNKVKAKIKKMTVDPADLRRFYSNKEKFLMNIKLFIVMGVCWNSEIVTFFLLKNLKKKYWINILINDTLNCLQSVFIFIFFLLKRSIYQALRSRLGLDTKKKIDSECNVTITL